jgi:uncharacterized protein YjdB
MLISLSPANIVQAAKLNSESVALMLGETYQLEVLDNKKAVKWYSSDKKVVAVNSKGKIRGKTVGKAIITAKIGKKKVECEISVSKPKKAIMMANTSTEQSEKQTHITLSSFDRLKTDMSYEDAVKIIGTEGMLVTQDQDKEGKTTSEVYTWYGKDGVSSASVVFKDGKLVEKGQVFLD